MIKNKINFQRFAATPFVVDIDGVEVELLSRSGTWEADLDINTKYTIQDNKVIYNNKILQYNNIDVLPTDYMVITTAGSYTTRPMSTKVNIDLTTLSGWSNVSSGEHNLQIQAKADGFAASEKSAAIKIIKTIASGETWLLNENLGMATLSKTSVTFTSNNENFVSIAYSTSSMGPQTLWYYKNDTEYVVACEYGTYSNEAYRTITFENTPTGNLLTWLNANGKRQ